MPHRYLYFALVLLFLTSCSPLRVVRLTPEDETQVDRYLYGNPILSQTERGVTVNVNYYDASRDYLVFDLEVVNNSGERFDYDPAQTTLIPDVGESVQAIDPEVQLLAMDIETIRQIKTNRTLGWIGAAVLVAGVTYDIANGSNAVADGAANNFGDQLLTELSLNVVDALTFAVVDNTINNDYRNAAPYAGEIPTPENRFFWLDHSLRLTTIQPGERAYGKIVFPRNDEASNYKFLTSVAGQEFAFNFVQRVFRP